MKSLRTSLVGLSLLAALASCHAPTAPQPQSATLTLTLPDFARMFDTVVFKVRYSDSLYRIWYYEWDFGDGTDTSVPGYDSTIRHVFYSSGQRTIRVFLKNGTANIAQDSAVLQVGTFDPPSFSLTVPDTVFWGDSAVMSVSNSQPLLPSWCYTWSFGDSSSQTTSQTSVLHYFDQGTFTINVTLSDPIHHILLATRTSSITSVPRHFDLSLLESMPYVELSWNTQHAGPPKSSVCGDVETFLVKPLLWNGGHFSMDSTMIYDTNGYYWRDNELRSNSFSGQADTMLTQLQSFSHSTLQDVQLSNDHTGEDNSCQSSSRFQIASLPFISATGSELRFEARGNLIKRAAYRYTFWSDTSYDDWSNLSDSAYVLVRFHN